MYTIDRYLNDTRLLAGSLVIKHHNIGIVINNGLINKYKIYPSTEYVNWKYYLNLSGVKHYLTDPSDRSKYLAVNPELTPPLPTDLISTNSAVMLENMDGGGIIELTNTISVDHPRTHRELNLRSNFYLEIINKYPNDSTYIDGCINPVTTAISTEASDGEILAYSKEYVNSQEYSLIRELSNSIRLFFYRWYISDYNITDELYMSSVLGVLYGNLPNIIVNLRTRKINTMEAHDFHIEHFFRSHLDLWDNVKHLNKPVIMWLYKNLVTLINEVGTNKTLSTIIDKILTPSGIGVGEHILTSNGGVVASAETLATVVKNLMIPNFKNNPGIINVSKLNAHYPDSSLVVLPEDTTSRGVANTNVSVYNAPGALSTLIAEDLTAIGSNISVDQPTKVLDFGTIETFKLHNNNLVETILDYWLVKSVDDIYVGTHEFVDPNTGLKYELTTRTGIILFYYLLFKKIGVDTTTVTKIRYRNILKNNVSLITLLDGLLTSTGNEYVANIIIDNLPSSLVAISTVSDFHNEISKQINLYTKIWHIDSNVNNTFLSANIKEMVKKLYSNDTVNNNFINLDAATGSIDMDTILSTNNVVIDTSGTYDAGASLTSLFKLFTGYDLSSNTIALELYSNYKMILDKITSYSLQILPPTVSDGGISAPYSTISVNETTSGYIHITDAVVSQALEINPFREDPSFANTAKMESIAHDANIGGLRIFDGRSRLRLAAHSIDSLVGATRPITYIEILQASYIEFTTRTSAASRSYYGGIDAKGISSNPIGAPSGAGINIDALNRGSLVGNVVSKQTTNTSPVTNAEIQNSSYVSYGPATSIAGNVGTSIPTAVAISAQVSVSSNPSANNIQVFIPGPSVSVKPNVTVEIISNIP